MLKATWQLELPKLFKRRMTWVLALSLAVLLVTLDLGMYLMLRNPAALEGRPEGMEEMMWASLCWPTAFSDLLETAAGNNLGGLLLVILAGAVVAQEYSWRTVNLWLGHGLPRPVFLGAKFVALALACLLLTLVPVLVGVPLTAWFTAQHSAPPGLADLPLAALLLGTLRTAYTLLPYAALTLMVAVLARSTVAAIGVGLAYALLVEQMAADLLRMAGGLWADLTLYLPGGLARALMRLNREAFGLELGVYGGRDVETLGPSAAALGIALYTAVFLGMALWTFRRQDLTE